MGELQKRHKSFILINADPLNTFLTQFYICQQIYITVYKQEQLMFITSHYKILYHIIIMALFNTFQF